MHGEGHRRNCPVCGQAVIALRNVLANRELRGPRQITSSNVDRIFDDAGERFLIIEEKAPGERISKGQRLLLHHLAQMAGVTVWGVRGTPDDLSISHVRDDGTCRPLAIGDMDLYQKCVEVWFEEGT